MALPGQRIFEIYIEDDEEMIGSRRLRVLNPHPPPAIRGVCKESWQITDENGKIRLGPNIRSGTGGYWFNPEVDMVYTLQTRHTCYSPYVDPFWDSELYLPWVNWEDIRHVACEWSLVDIDPEWVFRLFPNVETVTAVVDTFKLGNKLDPQAARPELLPLLDEDIVSKSGNDWGWYSDFVREKLKDERPDGPVPRLDGAEVVRRDKTQAP